MDEMKIKLSTKMMRSILGRIISKAIYKNMGIKPDIDIKEIGLEMKNGKIYFHINVDGNIDDSAILKVTKLIDSENWAVTLAQFFFFLKGIPKWSDLKEP